MTRKALLAGIVIALGACAFNAQMRETVHRSIATTAQPAIRITNQAGSIDVTAGKGSTVDVTAIKTADDAASLKATTIDVSAANGTVTIATNTHGSRGAGVEYQVAVPPNASLTVDNSAGSVDVRGVRGNVALTTQAGSITADLGTVAGSRSVTAKATTGSVSVTIASDSSARVQARSTVGSFSSDFSSIASTRQNLVGTSAGGKIGGGAATIDLTSTTGSIALKRKGS